MDSNHPFVPLAKSWRTARPEVRRGTAATIKRSGRHSYHPPAARIESLLLSIRKAISKSNPEKIHFSGFATPDDRGGLVVSVPYAAPASEPYMQGI